MNLNARGDKIERGKCLVLRRTRRADVDTTGIVNSQFQHFNLVQLLESMVTELLRDGARTTNIGISKTHAQRTGLEHECRGDDGIRTTDFGLAHPCVDPTKVIELQRYCLAELRSRVIQNQNLPGC